MLIPGRAAATVIILRDRLAASPEILMMERASSMAFAAGALVFPGGAVDEGDHALAAMIGGDLERDEAAARIAAIRETLEESGLAVALDRPVGMEQAGAMRDALAQGASMAAVLDVHGLQPDLGQLLPFARWHPAVKEPVHKVFDTRFYLVRAPDEQEATVDRTENVRLFWSGAADTLVRCDNGDGHVIFPTRCNLERLAQFASFDEIAAHAASIPVEKVTPRIEERDGQHHLCIPAHLGYPVTSHPMTGMARG
nr:NUDIX domain-containing protein [Sphingobium sp.]